MSGQATVDGLSTYGYYINECPPSLISYHVDHRRRHPSPFDLASLPTVALRGLALVSDIIIIYSAGLSSSLSLSFSPPHALGCALAHGVRAIFCSLEVVKDLRYKRAIADLGAP